MDYLNNDCTPNLLRFMSVKIKGKKCSSYYNFLHGIIDESPDLAQDARYLPVFSDDQVSFINYLSDMLPLVRSQLNESERALVFIRKVSDEYGITMPFIYVGTGKLTNPRKQMSIDEATGKTVTTYLYDRPKKQFIYFCVKLGEDEEITKQLEDKGGEASYVGRNKQYEIRFDSYSKYEKHQEFIRSLVQMAKDQKIAD